MKLYKTTKGFVIEENNQFYLSKHTDWNTFINRKNLFYEIQANMNFANPKIEYKELIKNNLLPPVQNQEVWAAGVTYFNSKLAREEESKSSIYNKVYNAERPELFFKSIGEKVVGHKGELHIRRDSKWNVPEPELCLFINSFGQISGYTIANDMSSRDIEGENPLYLPQAKTYDKSAAIGPCIYVTDDEISMDSKITLQIEREKAEVFSGEILLNQLKRPLQVLVNYLFRENSFPNGCFLMTGTGIIPPTEFTLKANDIVHISIDNIGVLTNTIKQKIKK